MPINESRGFRRSNLTKEQQREAEAAIYGLTPTNYMDVSQLTPQDVEKMRALVAAHDRQTSKITEFDLNRPPQAGLVFRPFPRMIYHHAARQYRTVESQEELNEYLEAGWSKEPYRELIDGIVNSSIDAAEPDDSAEISQINEQLKRKQKK